MPWIRTPAGTLVPDEFLAEVQLLFNIAGAIEDCDLSDEERGLMEERLTGLERDLDKEYINECDDSWDDRTEVGVFGDDDKHERMMAGQTQGTDGLPDDGTIEEKMMDEDEMAGERTQLDDKVELKAGEQTQLSDVELSDFELNGVELRAGERTQMRVVEYGEQTQGGVEETSCGGSVATEVGSGSEDWMQDSVVIDIGADATVWGGELDIDADEKGGVMRNSCSGSLEVAAQVGFGSAVWMDDSAMNDTGGWDCDFDADTVGNLIAIEVDAAGLDSLVGGGSVMIPELGFVSEICKLGVGLEPLTLAARLLIKEGSETESKVWIDCGLDSFSLFGSSSDSGGGSEDYVSFGSESEKLIMFDDCAGGFQKDDLPEFGCSSVVAELFRVVGYGLLDQLRFFSRNVLYDPGGSLCYVLLLSLFGLSSWGLLVCSVFASVLSASISVILVVLRAFG